ASVNSTTAPVPYVAPPVTLKPASCFRAAPLHDRFSAELLPNAVAGPHLPAAASCAATVRRFSNALSDSVACGSDAGGVLLRTIGAACFVVVVLDDLLLEPQPATGMARSARQ